MGWDRPGGNFGKIQMYRPDPDSIWRCPCGRQDKYRSLISHRKGWKKRPECAGRIVAVDAVESPGRPLEFPDRPLEPQGSPLVFGVPGLEVSPDASDELSEDDAESIARRLNEQKQQYVNPAYLVAEGNGSGGSDGYQIGEGDFFLERPPEDTAVSQARETVYLPIFVRVMYDWARGEGWHRGDGSLSAFVADCLLDHFQHTWHKTVAVVDLVEVEVVDGGSSERGHLPTGNGANPTAKRTAKP